MINVFAKTFMTATGQPARKRWDAPKHWRQEDLPLLRTPQEKADD